MLYLSFVKVKAKILQKNDFEFQTIYLLIFLDT